MPIELGYVQQRDMQPCATCGENVLTPRGSIPRHDHTDECVAFLRKRVDAVEHTLELLKQARKKAPKTPDTTTI